MVDGPAQTPKLADVARMAGVGTATASRALNGGKNVSKPAMERILDAIQKLDYRPNRVAQSLKGASSGVFGMIVPSIADDFFAHCAEAVEAFVRDRGSLLVVASSRDDDAIAFDSVRQLLRHNIDGLIVAGSKPPSRDLVRCCGASGCRWLESTVRSVVSAARRSYAKTMRALAQPPST